MQLHIAVYGTDENKIMKKLNSLSLKAFSQLPSLLVANINRAYSFCRQLNIMIMIMMIMMMLVMTIVALFPVTSVDLPETRSLGCVIY